MRTVFGVRGKNHWYLAPQGLRLLSLIHQEFSSKGWVGLLGVRTGGDRADGRWEEGAGPNQAESNSKAQHQARSLC